METGRIGVRYAKAAFHLAKEQGRETEVRKDLLLIQDLYAKTEDLQNYIESPLILSSKKLNFIKEQLSEYISKISQDLLRLIINQGREAYILSVCRIYNSLYKEDSGIKEAELITSTEINHSLISEFEELLKKSLKTDKVEITHSSNPDLIGGYILRIDDLRYDNSIRTMLKNMNAQIKQNA